MGHKRSEWEDTVRAALGDLGVRQSVDTIRVSLAIEKALATLSSDRPYETVGTLAGDGTTYDLTLSSWEDRWSRVIRVEYPAGEKVPVYLEARRYMVLPGTTTFRLLEDVPATGESAKVTYATRWPSPNDTASTDKVPAGWFEGVANLAAAEVAQSVALEWARKQSQSVAGIVIDREADPLFTAAKHLRSLYQQIVLGVPMETPTGSGSVIAYAIEDQQTFPDTLFRRRVS